MAQEYTPLTREEIAGLWGGPLPDLEPVYVELGAGFRQGRPELAPYMMKKIFSPQEARLAAALPGNPVAVAEKTGLPADEVAETLHQMVIRGKIAAVGDEEYVRFTNLGNFKDWVYAQERFDQEYDQATARMMMAWDYVGDFFTGILPGTGRQYMRIVPKWASIKDLPGVMPCENIPEMLRAAADEVSFNRCPCRAVANIAEYGVHRTDTCRSGLREGHEPREGVCMAAGERGKYFVRYLGGYRPTREELERRLEEIEQAGTYYSIGNIREFMGLCNCCDDCHCGVRMPYDLGDEDFYAKSRFEAYVDDPDACIGCGACAEICPFHESVRLVDGIAQVDPDRCHGCGNCVVHCPTGALRMRLVRPADHIPRLGGKPAVRVF